MDEKEHIPNDTHTHTHTHTLSLSLFLSLYIVKIEGVVEQHESHILPITVSGRHASLIERAIHWDDVTIADKGNADASSKLFHSTYREREGRERERERGREREREERGEEVRRERRKRRGEMKRLLFS